MMRPVVLLAALMLPVALQAAQQAPRSALASARQTVSVTATGQGTTVQAATTRALAAAVAQVNGSVAASAGGVQTTQTRDVVTPLLGNPVIIDGQREQSGVAAAASRGAVRRHQVLSQRQLDRQLWEVTVRADVYTSEQDAAREALPRLAVMLQAGPGAQVTFPALSGPRDVASRFRDQLQASLLETGAVKVLDREFLAATDDELALAASQLRTDGQGKVGQRMSADYAVAVKINALRLARTPFTVSGMTMYREDAELDAMVQVIDVATQELVKSQEVRRFLTQDQLLALAERDGINRRMYPARFEQALLRELALPVRRALIGLVVPDALSRLPQETELQRAPAPQAPESPGSSEKPFSW